MEIFDEIEPLRTFLIHKRALHQSIGLVPTMGALHSGHLALIKESKSANDVTVCSIYVNPTQFNNPTDLEKYPRTWEQDKKLLLEAGCEVIFVPSNNEIYAKPSSLRFDFGSLDKILEGKFRPGHFSGVALVVSKLFNIVQPQRAYFGQKDFQQYKVISKIVEELLFDLELCSVPIVRESSGLAMSSRNQRLSEVDRSNATVLYQSLVMAKDRLLKGEKLDSVRDRVREKCEQFQNIKLEYFELADIENLNPTEIVTSKTILLIAAYVGEVRLIDNLLIE
jgi:pantoate--beta-alanine ligase